MADQHKCTHCGKVAPCAFIDSKPYCLDCASKYIPKKNKGIGCGTILIVVALIFLSLVFSASNSDTRKTMSSSTSIPRVTAVPTSTPALDDPIAWASYAADKHMPKDMMLSEVQISLLGGNKYLSIACDMEIMWDSDDYLSSAADLICDVIPSIRDKQGFDHVTFLFYAPFRDKYGNTVQELSMRAMYSRSTLQKVNAEYFGRYTSANPEGVFKAADTHMIHPSLKD